MKSVISPVEAAALIKNGSCLMVGGFLKCGSPDQVLRALIQLSVKELTLIANDTSFVDSDRGLLIQNKCVKKAIVSHIGTNPETGRQMHEGTLEVELVPQGTLAERIRAGGAGLGGFLTPTGVGTCVQEGKQVLVLDGRTYLLELPLKADVALIYGTRADRFGNITFKGATRNFNPVMATAAACVIAEVDEISDTPLPPDEIIIPGLFIDYLVLRRQKPEAGEEATCF